MPHGNAAVAHVVAGKLGLRSLLGPPCPERDVAYALIISRAIQPKSKALVHRPLVEIPSDATHYTATIWGGRRGHQ